MSRSRTVFIPGRSNQASRQVTVHSTSGSSLMCLSFAEGLIPAWSEFSYWLPTEQAVQLAHAILAQAREGASGGPGLGS